MHLHAVFLCLAVEVFMLRVASHQPSFMPWVGFWNKFVHSDVFVLSAGVQYSKSDVVSRVRFGDGWLSLPVVRSTRSGFIRDVRFDRSVLPTIAKRLQFSFSRKLPGFVHVDAVCRVLMNCHSDFLLDLNLGIFGVMAEALPERPRLVLDMEGPSGDCMDKTTRLFARISRHIDVAQYVYLSGRGALDYLSSSSIPDGVSVQVQRMSSDLDSGTALSLWAKSLSLTDTVRSAGVFENASIQ
jgi:hypothetical protein